MIRTALILTLIGALAVAAFALAGDPGSAGVEWLGWRIDMTAAAAALTVLFATLIAIVFWRAALWMIETPRRRRRARQETRRRQGVDVLSRGFLAAAGGDGPESRRLAQKAADLVEDAPALVRVLAAQAAEAAGDTVAAQAAYNAMLGFPEMRLAGLRGLMQTALMRGDKAQALRHAQTAFGLGRTARWAWRALLESRLESGDWAAALELVKSALERKVVTPLVAERARAALLAASAAGLESSPDARGRAQALEFAVQSAKLKPGFAPGVVMAARLWAADGKPARAAAAIEHAWREAPHPALWLAYRDLRTDETPKARAKRLQGLAALNPTPRESRILDAEQALMAGDPASARDAALPLAAEAPSARLCGLLARIAHAAGDPDEARAWMARGAGAPQEPDWSDLDPEGHAFAYQPADWARLVSTYAETGELIHPRFERGERMMTQLPGLAAVYEPATAFLGDLASGAPLPDDPGPRARLDPAPSPLGAAAPRG